MAANCRINSLAEGQKDNENLPRQGLVNQVCREWLLHEDKALAHRLQDEEYQHHLGSNKEKNAILRQDTPKAKEEQQWEDEEAVRAQNIVDRALAKQEARDASVAFAIATELDRIEEEKKRQQELEDKLFAKTLLEREKTKVRHTREQRPRGRDVAGNVTGDLSDLSDFCLKPSSSMDEEEMRRLQEGQDEELARLLQEQDLKRRGDLMQEDQLIAIETQDRELAKILQEQEKAKAKKAREKARQKALLKKRADPRLNESQSSGQGESLNENQGSDPYYDQPHYDTVSPEPTHRPSSPQYAIPSFIRRPQIADTSFESRRDSSFDEHTPNERRPTRSPPYVDRELRPRINNNNNNNNNTSPPPMPGYTNIACAIDPTYQRRIMQGELTPPPSMASPPPAVVSPGHPTSRQSPSAAEPPPPISSSSYGSRKSSTESPGTPSFEEEEEGEEGYLPPPYMPIQGQRRLSSLEKRSSNKFLKEKGAKDGACKQQ